MRTDDVLEEHDHGTDDYDGDPNEQFGSYDLLARRPVRGKEMAVEPSLIRCHRRGDHGAADACHRNLCKRAKWFPSIEDHLSLQASVAAALRCGSEVLS